MAAIFSYHMKEMDNRSNTIKHFCLGLCTTFGQPMLAAFHEVVFLDNVWHEQVWLPCSSTWWYAMIAAIALLCHSTKTMQMWLLNSWLLMLRYVMRKLLVACIQIPKASKLPSQPDSHPFLCRHVNYSLAMSWLTKVRL